MTREELLAKHGEPVQVLDHGHVRLIDIERFISFVDVGDDEYCWTWKGGKGAQGHGRFWLNGSMRVASRVAFIIWNGPIPEGLLVLHNCDNPPCCNPRHLRVGTSLDNITDMYARNPRSRMNRPKGQNNHNTKMTYEMVMSAAERISSGSSFRKEAKRIGVATSSLHAAIRGRGVKDESK